MTDFAMQAIGGSLIRRPIDLGKPAPGQVRVRHTLIGVNFIDILQRRGTANATTAADTGFEAVGVVEAVGEDVSGITLGMRVGTVTTGTGAYATARNVAADGLIPIPPSVSDEAAAALLFKGLTAQYLVRKTYRVQSGDVVLVHAAAGGVGLVLCQWASALGATVIGCASTDEKCAVAARHGATFTVNSKTEQIAASVSARTAGAKANVVYDSVGRDTWEASLDSLRPFGMLVIFGGASGPTPPIDPEVLNRKGCLYLTRPSVFTHNATRAARLRNAADLFAALDAGHVKPVIGSTFRLEDAMAAQAAIESRAVSGAILLRP